MFCQLSYSRVIAYPSKVIRYTWPNGVMFISHIFKWKIQRIFNYSRFSVKGSQYFENRFLRLSYSISSSYEIINYFLFTYLNLLSWFYTQKILRNLKFMFYGKKKKKTLEKFTVICTCLQFIRKELKMQSPKMFYMAVYTLIYRKF